MAKKITQYIKNPKFGQGDEPEWLEIPQMVSNDGEILNRLTSIEKLEYNATQVTNNGYDGLANALASVTDDKYKVKGIVLTWYDTTETKWKSMRYNGEDSSGWETIDNWIDTSIDTSNFATLEQLNEKSDKIDSVSGGTGTVTQEIQPNTYYEFGECTNLTVTLAAEIPNIYNEYMFEFTSGTTPTTLGLPSTVKWNGGNAPTIEASKSYIVAIVNNIAVIGGA